MKVIACGLLKRARRIGRGGAFVVFLGVPTVARNPVSGAAAVSRMNLSRESSPVEESPEDSISTERWNIRLSLVKIPETVYTIVAFAASISL